jgi:hypothetical protein
MDNYDPVDRPTEWERNSAGGAACGGGCLLFVVLGMGLTTLGGYVASQQVATTFAVVVALVVSITLPAWLYERWIVNKAQENYNWRMHRVREEEQERRGTSRRRRRR